MTLTYKKLVNIKRQDSYLKVSFDYRNLNSLFFFLFFFLKKVLYTLCFIVQLVFPYTYIFSILHFFIITIRKRKKKKKTQPRETLGKTIYLYNIYLMPLFYHHRETDSANFPIFSTSSGDSFLTGFLSFSGLKSNPRASDTSSELHPALRRESENRSTFKSKASRTA